MSDNDDGGIVSEIADAARDAGGTITSEFSKFGKSAVSQITGGAPSPDNASPKTKGPTQNASTSDSDDHSIISEFKKLGQAAIGQVTGHEEPAALSAMKKKDEEASKKEYREVVKQIYAHAAKRAKEQKRQGLIEERQEEQQKQLAEVEKKETPGTDIQKTRAEIKNYGAE